MRSLKQKKLLYQWWTHGNLDIRDFLNDAMDMEHVPLPIEVGLTSSPKEQQHTQRTCFKQLWSVPSYSKEYIYSMEVLEDMINYKGWKHGKLYKTNCQKNIKLIKRQFFMKTQESIFKFYLNFHFETIEPIIGFIVNQLQNFKNIGIIKVSNK
jgi:hypothetical protein